MGLSDRAKVLLLIVLIALVIYFLCGSKSEPIHNEGMLTQDTHFDENQDDIIDIDENSIPVDLESKQSEETNSVESENLRKKMKPRSEQESNYRSSSFKDGNRKSKSDDLDSFFNGLHLEDGGLNAKGFSPVVANEGKYAAYMSDKGKKKMTDKDKFNPSSLLPREKSNDWFDDPHEATSIKSSKLLNIHRPTGVNTIQSTLKIPSHDIRGTPANPKYPISPWNNSSVEPDTNLRNQSLCY
jgi:hypothetical protein